jgi:hypothetical protein
LLDADKKHDLHHAFKDLRLDLGDLRSRCGVVALGDLAWRYNCALHPIMHDIMHVGTKMPPSADAMAEYVAAVRNARLALAAVEAVAGHPASGADAHVGQCVRSSSEALGRLETVLKEQNTRELKQAVGAVRKCFVDLASTEFAGSNHSD